LKKEKVTKNAQYNALYDQDEKITKIKIGGFKKNLVQIVLWILLIFLVFRGVILTVNPVDTEGLKKYVDAELKKQAEQQKNSVSASTFAENALRVFFEYHGDNNEYKARLQDYFSQSIVTSASRESTTRVNDVRTVNQRVKDNLILVDCKVITENNHPYRPMAFYSPGSSASPSPTPSEKPNSKKTSPSQKTSPKPNNQTDGMFEQNEFYIRVYVSVKDGKYLVESYPTFVNAPVKSSESSIIETDGDKIERGKEYDEIQESAKSFLKTYCEGSSADLSFFFAKKENAINSLGGIYIFSGIEKFELMKSNGKYVARVTYKTDNSSLGFVMQYMKIIFIEKDGKFMVESVDF
jgi:hypothetical protein